VLFVLPVAAFLFAVGWSLIWIDSKKSPRKSVGTNGAAEGDGEVLSFELVQEPDALAESANV
jgi:hypothetical protein